MAAIIFDMDGTLADSFDYVADYIAKRAKKYPLSDEQRDALRDLPMAAMARSLGISWWQIPDLFYSGRRNMSHSMGKVAPFEGMPEVVAKLHAEGHELFVVSSNSVRNVRRFLHHYDLHKYFLELYGGIGIFGKATTLRKLIKEHSLETKHCIYVGDELRDIEASQSIGLPVVAVNWGFARDQDLRDLKPKAVVDTPDKLLGILEEFS